MTGLARTRIGHSPPSAPPRISVAPPLQPIRPLSAGVRATSEAASTPVSTPSMRGLEVTIAIASLASALLLGLLR
jgi:hypothetical protein